MSSSTALTAPDPNEIWLIASPERFLELTGNDDAPWAGDQDAVLDAVEEFFTGARRRPLVDRALATVLFTDVVGSTALAAGSETFVGWTSSRSTIDASERSWSSTGRRGGHGR